MYPYRNESCYTQPCNEPTIQSERKIHNVTTHDRQEMLKRKVKYMIRLLRIGAMVVILVSIAIVLATRKNPINPQITTLEPTIMAISHTSPDSSQKKYSRSAYDITPLAESEVKELADLLERDAYEVTQRAGTEPPFCGTLLDNKKDGTYVCIVCGLPLFSSDSKFTSGTGWPSFFQPFDPDHIGENEDLTLGRTRTEIVCNRCDAHLGHVFKDGPKPTGLRYCLNSLSLTFYDNEEKRPEASQPVKTETAYFAGGCFWGIEHYFGQGAGVIDASSGYMQGDTNSPTYKDVCKTNSGHAETVRVVFDPEAITFEKLLEAFFKMHDATQLDRQGPDVGTQYRSGIWFTNDAQHKTAIDFIDKITSVGIYKDKKIVTQIEKAEKFWPAEDYHQDYVDKTGRPCHIADPWN